MGTQAKRDGSGQRTSSGLKQPSNQASRKVDATPSTPAQKHTTAHLLGLEVPTLLRLVPGGNKGVSDQQQGERAVEPLGTSYLTSHCSPIHDAAHKGRDERGARVRARRGLLGCLERAVSKDEARWRLHTDQDGGAGSTARAGRLQAQQRARREAHLSKREEQRHVGLDAAPLQLPARRDALPGAGQLHGEGRKTGWTRPGVKDATCRLCVKQATASCRRAASARKRSRTACPVVRTLIKSREGDTPCAAYSSTSCMAAATVACGTRAR
jgi:hypothetical protein